MAEPSEKRRRTTPCPCPICCDSLRDLRTIDRHVNQLYTPTPGNPINDLGSNEIDFHVFQSEESLTDDTNSPADAIPIPVPQDRLTMNVLQEAKLKLERGHSISDIGQHLRNASTLVSGNQIPTTWPEVLKLMNTLGYSRPQHYKVCVSTTHSFLLRGRETHSACPICGKRWQHCIDYYCFLWLVCNGRAMQPAYGPLAWERLAQ